MFKVLEKMPWIRREQAQSPFFTGGYMETVHWSLLDVFITTVDYRTVITFKGLIGLGNYLPKEELNN